MKRLVFAAVPLVLAAAPVHARRRGHEFNKVDLDRPQAAAVAVSTTSVFGFAAAPAPEGAWPTGLRTISYMPGEGSIR